MRAQACWIVAAGRAQLQDVELAPVRDGEVLVQTLFSAISRGTETLVYQGRVPISEAARMRAPFQEGEFSFPLKYGYINVGRVLDGPAALRGKTVFSLFPHQTRFVVAAEAVCPVPDTVPAERAVLAAGMETAVNALWDAEPKVGDRIAVVGAGVIGSLCAYLAAQIPGTSVQLVDTNAERAQLAEKLGCYFALPQAAHQGADLVFHASGSAAGLATAMRAAGREARVVELSWYGTTEVPLALGEAFHSQRLQLRSSQVGGIPPAQAARWNYRRRLECALELLSDSTLDGLISGESAFAQLPQALSELCDQPGALCHRIRYPH